MSEASDGLNAKLDRIQQLTRNFLTAAESGSPEAPRLADELARELAAAKAAVQHARRHP